MGENILIFIINYLVSPIAYYVMKIRWQLTIESHFSHFEEFEMCLINNNSMNNYIKSQKIFLHEVWQ